MTEIENEEDYRAVTHELHILIKLFEDFSWDRESLLRMRELQLMIDEWEA